MTNPLPQLPLELKVTNVPRLEVKWNPMCDRMDPRETLFMMMFNPVIWAMFFFGLLGGGSGECAFIAFLCFLFNSILIAALLWAPLKDKKLARAGHAIIASIDDLRTALDPNGKPYYRADISFDWLGVQQYHAIALSRREYRILNSRTAEVILYDPKTDTPRIYAFCRYHPVMTVSMIMNKTFP